METSAVPAPRTDLHSPDSNRAETVTAAFGIVARGGGASLSETRWRTVCRAIEGHGLDVVARFSVAVLQRECGLTPAQARRLHAAFTLGREIEAARSPERPVLRQPSVVARLLTPDLRGLEVETFHVLLLDARHRLKTRILVSRGTLNSSPVHPREVFGPALRMGAAAVIVVHNHPSGDPEPSACDIDVTHRLTSAGRLVGVPLLDHVIWAGGRFTSLREGPHWPR